MLFPGVTASTQAVSICSLVESNTDFCYTRTAGLLCALLTVAMELICGSARLEPIEFPTSGNPAEHHPDGSLEHYQETTAANTAYWAHFSPLALNSTSVTTPFSPTDTTRALRYVLILVGTNGACSTRVCT